jgi:hypothetical protein
MRAPGGAGPPRDHGTTPEGTVDPTQDPGSGVRARHDPSLAARLRPRLRWAADLIQPYRTHLFLLAYTPLVLSLDAHPGGIWLQRGLGLLTFLVLWLVTRRLPAAQRRQVWLCVLVATGFEVLGSQVWGVYRYRHGNIPLYVPPGHGLVYWFGLTADRLPVFRRHGRRAALVVLGGCTLYAALGLTLLPPFTHRLDLQGALCLPVLAWCILRTPRFALFAAIFVATLDLELSGTLAGDWHWLAVAPWDHVPSGNPPSAIAGGYCIIDGTVLALGVLLDRCRHRLGSPVTETVARALRRSAARDARPAARPTSPGATRPRPAALRRSAPPPA